MSKTTDVYEATVAAATRGLDDCGSNHSDKEALVSLRTALVSATIPADTADSRRTCGKAIYLTLATPSVMAGSRSFRPTDP